MNLNELVMSPRPKGRGLCFKGDEVSLGVLGYAFQLRMSSVDTPLTPEQSKIVLSFLKEQSTRLSSLYWIVDKDGKPCRFKMNWAQRELHNNIHRRNNILKVRQLGISTYVAMLILDTCLFTPNFKAGIVDKSLKDAEAKLQKIKFAFERLDGLPEDFDSLPAGEQQFAKEVAEVGRMVKEWNAGVNFSKQSVTFPNGSEITVGSSLRGGTLQLLHVSELGYVACHDPMRANEILTGSLNTVGKGCRVIMESTHEGGRYGVNYEQIMAAMDNIGKDLSPLDFKFFFFPWWKHPEYRLENKPHPTAEQVKYFAGLERALDVKLTDGQKAWYIAMQRVQRSKMQQEYPSTPDEALNPIMDGTIYSKEISSLHETGKLKAEFEPDPHRPIYACWDFGIGDYMSIWWVQPDGRGNHLVLDNYTAHQMPLSHYIGVLAQHDALWHRCAACIVPHDGAKRTLELEPQDAALTKAGYAVTRVPRTSDLWASVDNTRELLRRCVFHQRCSEPTNCEGVKYLAGVDALMNYRMGGSGVNGNLAQTPLHDQCSHAADALRCYADAIKRGLIAPEMGWNRRRSLRRRGAFYELDNFGEKVRSPRSPFVTFMMK